MEEVRTMNVHEEDLLQHDIVWDSIADQSSEELDLELLHLGLDAEAVGRSRDLLAQHAGRTGCGPEPWAPDYGHNTNVELRRSCTHSLALHYHLEATKFVTARTLDDVTVRYRDNLVVGLCDVEAHVHDNWIFLTADEHRQIASWREELLVVYMMPGSINPSTCPNFDWPGHGSHSMWSEDRLDCRTSR